MSDKKEVLIFGATGNVGGAATRELLKRGWRVRAATRDPESEQAQILAELGAEVTKADMDDRSSLETAFDGMTRVFSVQNWVTNGVDGEVRQGKMVAEVAKSAGIKHLVYGSAGIGEAGTGVPHFQGKVEVERYMREDLGLRTTAIRPGPFMELMTNKQFFPPMVAWGAMPKVIGWDRKIPWTAVPDIGLAIANVLDKPEEWIGRDINLISDVESLFDCRELIRSRKGKKPLGVPIPLALFRRMVGTEFEVMWRWMVDWLPSAHLEEMIHDSRNACPELHTVSTWLSVSSNGHKGTGI